MYHLQVAVCDFLFFGQLLLLSDIVLPPSSSSLPADHADCNLHECHRYQRSGARWVSRSRRLSPSLLQIAFWARLSGRNPVNFDLVC